MRPSTLPRLGERGFEGIYDCLGWVMLGNIGDRPIRTAFPASLKDMPQGGGQDGADFRVSETDGSCSGVVCVACFHSVNMVN